MATVVCSGQDHMDFWLTDPDRKILFQEQSPLHPTADRRVRSSIVIEVNSTERYQSMDGFGFALTGGSALHIYQLENVTRAALLQELFAADKTNIGISYLRLSIGASDLNAVVFSYDDLGPGETDVNMTRFTLDADRTSLIPLLKEILAINPQIKLLGSPWSPPVWMKSNEKTIGGNLLRKYYDAYALYFVRYIQGMKAEGINIDAITIQNEALYGGNNPSMVMHAKEQAEFIKSSLGPAFRLNEIATKIFIYDHNPDRPDYPLTILADPEARNYVDGSAFHMYAGRIETLSLVHAAHPDKNIYFTEEWIAAPGNLKSDLAWHVKTLIVGATRNWARTVVEWNLASDSKWEPHTPRGCDNCLGALTIDGNLVHSPRNPGYYIIAHAAKFVRPNSVRIGTSVVSSLANVAFQRDGDGRRVLIVLNEKEKGETTFEIHSEGKVYQAILNEGSVGTFIWWWKSLRLCFEAREINRSSLAIETVTSDLEKEVAELSPHLPIANLLNGGLIRLTSYDGFFNVDSLIEPDCLKGKMTLEGYGSTIAYTNSSTIRCHENSLVPVLWGVFQIEKQQKLERMAWKTSIDDTNPFVSSINKE